MAGRSHIGTRARTSPPRLALLVAGALAALLLAATKAPAAPLETASLGTLNASNGIGNVPRVLTALDVSRYQKIFALQEKGNWKAADAEIAKLQNRVLMGHVLYQRYMHPTAYRSKFAELAAWLEQYGDLSGANNIYRLAVQRRPANTKAPQRPANNSFVSGYGVSEGHTIGLAYQNDKSRSDAEDRQVQALQRQIAGMVGRSPAAALRILEREQTSKLFNPVEYDESRWRIAAGFFYTGNDKDAYRLAAASAERSRRYVEIADWTAGLAAWRMGKMESARMHFEALAQSETASPWNIAAGAYWAARVQLVTKKPQNVVKMLDIAAKYPRTFYGLLASRLLAREIGFRWQAPDFAPQAVSEGDIAKSVLQVIALHEIGQDGQAEREVRSLYPQTDKENRGALLGLAERLGLAGAAMRLGSDWRDSQGEPLDAALYPLPHWEPEGGFSVDRALVFAFMRRESGFNAKAMSPVGARGLMQLMPTTASYVAGDNSLRGDNREKLFEPEFNISLGQRYLGYLLEHEDVNHNLFLLAAAYNGGPGNMKRWLRETKHQKDPLMFIESIPVLETRIFIEKVLTYFWIYRIRLGQDTPSLDAIVAGNWPYYLSLDSKTIAVAENVQNRR